MHLLKKINKSGFPEPLVKKITHLKEISTAAFSDNSFINRCFFLGGKFI